MDDIREIIHTLDDENKREFKHFLNRLKQKGNRKDVALFDLLQDENEFKSKDLINKLYGKDNREAYYALRKRLNKQLIEFVILKSREKDTTAISQVMEYINLSQYLYDHKKNRLAYRYLNLARKLAEEIEHHELMNAIYSQVIDKNKWQNESDLQAIIELHKTNKIKLEQEENINFANSILKQKLIEHQRETIPVDFNQLTSTVFSDFGINEAVLDNPRVLHKLMSLSRSVIIANKDFSSFEPFIKKKYEELVKKGAFTERSVFYKMGLLYYLAHTLYRNKKFNEAGKYLSDLKNCLNEEGDSYFVFYYPKYMQLLAAVRVFSKNLEGAQKCLNDLLSNKRINLEHSDRLNIIVNKGIYHFLDQDFSSSHKALHSIYHTDKWCAKHMGKEWVLKKNLMEVLLYFDMEKIDVAESRLRSIERTYKDLFKHPMYKRVKDFLSLIKLVIYNPEDAASEHFYKNVQEVIDWRPFSQEDLQAMGFYSWLKSKMQKRNMYEVWLELAEGVD